MRILVCGGRDYANWFRVYRTLDALLWKHGTLTVIHGGAKGADALAAGWCARRVRRETPGMIETIEERADWKAHGKAAGPIRNARMIEEHKPDLVLAFPGGRGTADMCAKARAAGVKVMEIEG